MSFSPGVFGPLLEVMPQFFCVLDSDLRYTYTNPAHRRLFHGRNLEGLTVQDAQPELAESEYTDVLHRVLNNGERFVAKASPAQINGELRYIDMLYTPVYNESGTISGVFSFGTDVTEEVLAKQQLRASEELLRVITNKVPAYVSYTDPEGRYKFLNDAYADWFGKPQHEFVGKTRDEAIPERYQTLAKENQMTAFSTGRSKHEVTLTRQDGKNIDLEVNYFADLDETGSVRGMVAVGIDVSEKLRRIREIEAARRELREVFDQIPYPLCVITGDDRRYLMANPSYETYIGRKAEGRTLEEVFEDVDFSLFRDIIESVFRTREPRSLREAPFSLRGTTGELSQRIVNAHYHPYRNEFTNLDGVFVIVQDVTEEIQAKRRIEEAVQIRDNFMALASHELKTPLTSMKLLTQLRIRSTANAVSDQTGVIMKYLEQQLTQIDRLTRLVDDMLDISRISSGRLDILKQEIDLSTLVTETFERLRPQLEGLGHGLELQIQSGIQGWVDAHRFEQIITNIAVNATRHAPESNLLARLNKTETSVLLVVEDDGPGIRAGKLDQIFNRFEQASRDRAGFGIGLYISREIARAHGGEITARNRPDGGAAFVISIPVEEVN